jgi:hypothetical protein
MRLARIVLVALAAPGLLAWGARSAAAQDTGGVAVVHMADGSELPLTTWSLSYEYQAWKEGTAQAFSQPAKREARELWSGKKVLALAGAVLEIQYQLYQRQVEGEPAPSQGAAVTGLVLSVDGKKTEIKVEPPSKELLLPAGGAKGLIVQARALDIHGETLTGTKRDYCLVSYTQQVECSAAASERVVRIEFAK